MGQYDGNRLDMYMKELSDIRRSATMICDSIRTREKTALSLLGVPVGGSLDGVDLSNCEPVRCPICITEFEDPCVAIKVCGHGLHKKCLDGLLAQHDNGGSRQVFLCPLCRAPFRSGDVLPLIGMHPGTGHSALWRSVQLCAPWKVQQEPSHNPERSGEKIDHLPEKLYISLRSLFKQTNELGRAFDSILQLREETARLRNEAVEEKRRVMGALLRKEAEMSRKEHEMDQRLQARIESVERREGRLLSSEYQNEEFIGQCVKAMKRKESSHLQTLESIVGRQKMLDRTREEISQKQEKVDSTLRELEVVRNRREKLLRSREERVRAERGIIASQRNSLMLSTQTDGCQSVVRNPAFSDAESDERNIPDTLEVIDIEDSSGARATSRSSDEESHGQRASSSRVTRAGGRAKRFRIE